VGEIIIKVPGDIKEVFEIDEISQTKPNKVEKLIEKIEHYNFVMKNLEKVLGSVEVEDVKEEDMYS
jgi:antitoxin component HigA of HigAB toxin-antitoxin module